MAIRRILPFLLTSLLGTFGTAQASTLAVSVSGQFSALPSTPTQLWAPKGSFSLSFNVNSTPLVNNVTSVGFDPQFSNFAYQLNGARVAATPSAMTFSTLGNGGLFTLFFGLEGAITTPEFVFYGPQAFSGATADPTFSAASLAVSEWTYSDPTTYDDNASPASVVGLAPVPEPSTALLFGTPFVTLALLRVRRLVRTS